MNGKSSDDSLLMNGPNGQLDYYALRMSDRQWHQLSEAGTIIIAGKRYIEIDPVDWARFVDLPSEEPQERLDLLGSLNEPDSEPKENSEPVAESDFWPASDEDFWNSIAIELKAEDTRLQKIWTWAIVWLRDLFTPRPTLAELIDPEVKPKPDPQPAAEVSEKKAWFSPVSDEPPKPQVAVAKQHRFGCSPGGCITGCFLRFRIIFIGVFLLIIIYVIFRFGISSDTDQQIMHTGDSFTAEVTAEVDPLCLINPKLTGCP